MNAANAAAPAASRRPWAVWAGVLCLVAFVALVGFHPGLRALAGRSWREVWSMPPAALALVVALKVGQALLSSLSWRNALHAAWPQSRLPYRFVLGVDQGQDVANTVLPGRAGTWAMLGVVRSAIHGARTSTLLAAWGVHNLAFILFALAASTLVAIGVPGRARETGGLAHRLADFGTDRPLLAGAAVVLLVVVLGVVAVRGRARLAELRQRVAAGVAILRSPGRYGLLLFLPALGAYGLRCAAYAVLLDAYGIPVTVWTVALALGSHALAGAVRLTPGGLGTTQVADVVALGAYAAPDVVTAYSLAEIALNAMVSAVVAVTALASLAGWHGSRQLLGHLRRGQLSTGLHALGARQRARRAARARRDRPGERQ
jgi:hypothetical protein